MRKEIVLICFLTLCPSVFFRLGALHAYNSWDYCTHNSGIGYDGSGCESDSQELSQEPAQDGEDYPTQSEDGPNPYAYEEADETT